MIVKNMENNIVGEDMICPVSKKHCDDECCTVGSECNISGDSLSESKPETKRTETSEEHRKRIIDTLSKIYFLHNYDDDYKNFKIKLYNHYYDEWLITNQYPNIDPISFIIGFINGKTQKNNEINEILINTISDMENSKGQANKYNLEVSEINTAIYLVLNFKKGLVDNHGYS